MFEVEYKGANAVVITTKKVRVVFDPRLSLVGGSDISVRDSIEVVTDDRFVVDSTSPKLLFDGPGEYEVGDVSLVGLPARKHTDTEEEGLGATIYRVVIGDVRIAVIGNIVPKLDDDQLEALGVVDVVVIPVGGGGYTLDASDAATMIRQIEPRAVIPVHYADSNLKYEAPQEDVDLFVKELGAGILEAGPKFKVKNDSSLPEQLMVVKITRSS